MTKKQKEQFEKNVRDLIRDIVGGMKLEDIKFLEKLEGEERKNFCQFCYTTYNSPFFKIIGEALSFQQLQYSALEAKDWEQSMFGRATINGISLMGEIFHKYALAWETEYAPNPEPFNAHQSFEHTTSLKGPK